MKIYLFLTAVVLFFSVANGQSSTAIPGSASLSTNSIASPSSPSSANTGSAWTILSLDDGQRINLCQRQISYCATQCGGPGGVSANFCNNVTMAWNCKCSALEAFQRCSLFCPSTFVEKKNQANNNAANATYLDPVPLAECNGKYVACQAACVPDANRSTCVQACTSKWACGTANSPPSYLQTQSETDQPSYNGPPPASTPSNSTQTNSTAPVNTAKASSAQKVDIWLEFAALLPIVLIALFQVQL